MVVYRYGERLLCLLLTNDILLEEVIDFLGLRKIKISARRLTALRLTLIDDFVAQLDALVADVDTRSSDQLLDLFLGLSAKRALQKLARVTGARHRTLR